jgi:hypothetical protein
MHVKTPILIIVTSNVKSPQLKSKCSYASEESVVFVKLLSLCFFPLPATFLATFSIQQLTWVSTVSHAHRVLESDTIYPQPRQYCLFGLTAEVVCISNYNDRFSSSLIINTNI